MCFAFGIGRFCEMLRNDRPLHQQGVCSKNCSPCARVQTPSTGEGEDASVGYLVQCWVCRPVAYGLFDSCHQPVFIWYSLFPHRLTKKLNSTEDFTIKTLFIFIIISKTKTTYIFYWNTAVEEWVLNIKPIVLVEYCTLCIWSVMIWFRC